MVHGKAIGGYEGSFVIFSVDNGYAVVRDEGVSLLASWGGILKYEMVADASLLSDSFVMKMTKKLSETPEKDAADYRNGGKETDFVKEVQDTALKTSRKERKPFYI